MFILLLLCNVFSRMTTIARVYSSLAVCFASCIDAQHLAGPRPSRMRHFRNEFKCCCRGVEVSLLVKSVFLAKCKLQVTRRETRKRKLQSWLVNICRCRRRPILTDYFRDVLLFTSRLEFHSCEIQSKNKLQILPPIRHTDNDHRR